LPRFLKIAINAIFGEEFFLACSDIVTETEQSAEDCADYSEKSSCNTETSGKEAEEQTKMQDTGKSEAQAVELEPNKPN